MVDAKTMLVIDDDPVVHDLMRRALSKASFHVEIASNGSEGLQRAIELIPDVITLDVLMPGQDGWTVLSELKADPRVAHIPVILVTVLDDKQMGYTLGAAEYLTKPIDMKRLIAIIRQYYADPKDGFVLIVEDDEKLRELERRTLERAGWNVCEAANGKRALERIKQERPKLILLDLIMPEMNGFELLEQLRVNPQWSSIPVIVVTARELTSADREALRNGVENILEKGAYSLPELLAKIRQIAATRSG